MRKVVYLIEQPLDSRNFERFGIQVWVDRNWTVEVWDLTPWAHPQVWNDYVESGREFKEFAGYFPIPSISVLRIRISNCEAVEWFVDLTGENYCSLRVKSSLVRRGAKRIICQTGSIPVPLGTVESGLASRLRRAVAKGPNEFLKLFSSAILRKCAAYFFKPHLAVVSGERSISSAGKSRAFLRAHSFDYDVYLNLAKSTCAPAGEYAVFIDQNLCFHSDFIYQEVPFFVTPEKYFPAICRGLRELADCLILDVRIAAHPRASYDKGDFDYFNGVAVVYGATAELIRNCKVVVCHDSTAIHFAVLFEKPIIFVTTDELIPFAEGRSIAQAASELGKRAINLDRDLHGLDWRKEMHVDYEKYAAYKNAYIKTEGSPECPMWEIVIDDIERRKQRTSVALSDESVCVGDRG